jgi:peptidoglycan/LPS O-acetylase OafA/YrhL
MKNPVYKFSLFAVILAIGFVIPERLQTIFHYYIYFIVGFQSFLYFTKNIKIREFLITVIISLLYIFFLKEKMAAYYAIFTVAGIFLLNYNLKWPQFFGNISYSLYLTHGMIGGTVIMFTDHGFAKSVLVFCRTFQFNHNSMVLLQHN